MVTAENLKTQILPFLKRDRNEFVWVAFCCRKLYVGTVEPKKCATCPKIPQPLKVHDVNHLDKVARILNNPEDVND